MDLAPEVIGLIRRAAEGSPWGAAPPDPDAEFAAAMGGVLEAPPTRIGPCCLGHPSPPLPSSQATRAVSRMA